MREENNESALSDGPPVDAATWCVQIVGRDYDECARYADETGYRTRISKRDGRALILTRDYDPSRINFEIANGRVTKASIG